MIYDIEIGQVFQKMVEISPNEYQRQSFKTVSVPSLGLSLEVPDGTVTKIKTLVKAAIKAHLENPPVTKTTVEVL